MGLDFNKYEEPTMHPSLLITSLIILSSLSACATLPPASLKPVEVGTGANEQFDAANTILYFPAGKPIPFRITASGSVMQKPIEHTETFILKKDIYSWRNLVSFDGKHWKPSEQVLKGTIEFFFNPKDVRFNAVFDEK